MLSAVSRGVKDGFVDRDLLAGWLYMIGSMPKKRRERDDYLFNSRASFPFGFGGGVV